MTATCPQPEKREGLAHKHQLPITLYSISHKLSTIRLTHKHSFLSPILSYNLRFGADGTRFGGFALSIFNQLFMRHFQKNQ